VSAHPRFQINPTKSATSTKQEPFHGLSYWSAAGQEVVVCRKPALPGLLRQAMDNVIRV